MTPENLGFFLSGVAAGSTFVGDVAVIAFVSAGLWRWGVAAGCTVLALLNFVGTALLVAQGMDPLTAAVAMMVTGIEAMGVLLPLAALATWIGWKFWNYAGGLSAK